MVEIPLVPKTNPARVKKTNPKRIPCYSDIKWTALPKELNRTMFKLNAKLQNVLSTSDKDPVAASVRNRASVIEGKPIPKAANNQLPHSSDNKGSVCFPKVSEALVVPRVKRTKPTARAGRNSSYSTMAGNASPYASLEENLDMIDVKPIVMPMPQPDIAKEIRTAAEPCNDFIQDIGQVRQPSNTNGSDIVPKCSQASVTPRSKRIKWSAARSRRGCNYSTVAGNASPIASFEDNFEDFDIKPSMVAMAQPDIADEIRTAADSSNDSSQDIGQPLMNIDDVDSVSESSPIRYSYENEPDSVTGDISQVDVMHNEYAVAVTDVSSITNSSENVIEPMAVLSPESLATKKPANKIHTYCQNEIFSGPENETTCSNENNSEAQEASSKVNGDSSSGDLSNDDGPSAPVQAASSPVHHTAPNAPTDGMQPAENVPMTPHPNATPSFTVNVNNVPCPISAGSGLIFNLDNSMPMTPEAGATARSVGTSISINHGSTTILISVSNNGPNDQTVTDSTPRATVSVFRTVNDTPITSRKRSADQMGLKPKRKKYTAFYFVDGSLFGAAQIHELTSVLAIGPALKRVSGFRPLTPVALVVNLTAHSAVVLDAHDLLGADFGCIFPISSSSFMSGMIRGSDHDTEKLLLHSKFVCFKDGGESHCFAMIWQKECPLKGVIDRIYEDLDDVYSALIDIDEIYKSKTSADVDRFYEEPVAISLK